MPIPAGVAVFARARLFASSSYNVKRSGTTFPKCVRVMFAGSPTDQDLESGILFLPNRVADSAQTAQCGQSFYLLVWFIIITMK